MKQKEIKKLLIEASKRKCTRERRDEIIELFKNATAFKENNANRHPFEDPRISIEEKAVHDTIIHLFFETTINRPDLLPELFPAFALACGYRKTTKFFSAIDWSLMPKPRRSKKS